jgi:iron complex transport system permease protein
LRLSFQIKFALLALLFIAAVLLSITNGGSSAVALSEIFNGSFILSEIRIPKTITAILAGCALSVSGLILQVIFRNPLAGPYVLGISSGASLMVALVVLSANTLSFLNFGIGGRLLVTAASITGSFFVTFAILLISRYVPGNTMLLLIGLMLAQIFSAIQISLEYFADPAALKSFVIWGMGTLSASTRDDVQLLAGFTLLTLLSGVMLIKPLNALLLGEFYAQSAGVAASGARFRLIMLSSVLTGVITAFCGPIAFVGTAVPVLSRMVFKTSRQQVHYVSCMLIGSIILLFSDAFAHTAIRGTALPVNMITTIIGAPVVIWLIFRNKQW